MDRRAALRAVAGLGATALAGCSLGDGPSDETPPPTLGGDPTIASAAFEDGAAVPARFTCDGEDASPPLSIADVPDDASSLALLVDDPDAPGGTFTHWLLWGVPTETGSIPEGVPRGETVEAVGGAMQGTNDAGAVGYSGPCPPPEDGPHTYRFRLFALAEPLSLPAGADRSAFDDARSGVARSEAVLTGSYDR